LLSHFSLYFSIRLQLYQFLSRSAVEVAAFLFDPVRQHSLLSPAHPLPSLVRLVPPAPLSVSLPILAFPPPSTLFPSLLPASFSFLLLPPPPCLPSFSSLSISSPSFFPFPFLFSFSLLFFLSFFLLVLPSLH
ncbi:hypothetical protein NYA10_29670, partial [Burkholderia thailandensis]|nr:hypothetical protein [Burkholderia thailandensis]